MVSSPLDKDISAALTRMGLMAENERPEASPLEGGVSSDIVQVTLAQGPVCIKRALARLKVAAVWEAPIERNAAEADWMRVAAKAAPGAVPRLLGVDEEAGLFVMDYLSPAEFPLWKTQLRDGTIEPATAAAVGRVLSAIHGTTADDPAIAETFANDETFHAIRLEPYLLATAASHPDRSDALQALAGTTAKTRRVLVHGDVSPKNILAGRDGPVFLDAECAWFGDPAFDLAFCLNHLLLKGVWRPHWRARYLDCFEALSTAYLDRVQWEPRADLERRTARLLPGLMLARIDGKSPVEYITADGDKGRVRDFARAWLADPPDRLADISQRWREDRTA